MPNPVKFSYGTYAQYKGITPDNDTIYFITDRGLIFKGDASCTNKIDINEFIDSSGNSYIKFTDNSGWENPVEFDVYSISSINNIINIKGIPDGGTYGQVLQKRSNDNNDVEWITLDGMTIIELFDDASTLTTEQLALAESDHCVIVYEGEYYYKNFYQDGNLEYISNYLIEGNIDSDGVSQKNLAIDISDGMYSFGTNGVSFPSLSNYVQKSKTVGLLKNNGSVDTNTYLTSAPVTSVNGQTGAVSITIPDVSGKENISNKVSAWSSTTTDVHYPSEKLVKDSLDTKLSNADVEALTAIDVDSAPTASSTNLVTSGGVYSEVHPTLGTSMPSGGFLPNVVYNLGTLSGDTTFLMASATDNTIANIWCWTFDTSSTAPTITWPQAITAWNGGSAPTINASKHYEVSVMNGIACYIEV